MADVTGARNTNSSPNQRKVDISADIRKYEPDAAALVVLSNILNKKKTGDPKFQWFEKDRAPRFDAINNGAGYANNATSLVVDNGAYFAQWDLVKVTRTGEVFRVDGVSTNTLTVTRGIGSGAAALNDNDELLIIGSAQREGDTSKPARSNNPVLKTNYTQIIRTPVHMTRTAMQSTGWTNPHDWTDQQREAAKEHQKDKEYVAWHGRPAEDLSNLASPIRYSGGALYFISTNVTDAGGTFTETEFNTVMRTGFRWGSSRKLGFGSGVAVGALNGYPSGKLQVVDQARKEYGLNVVRYTSPFGTLDLVYNKLFEGTNLAGYLAGIDPDQLAYRYLNNENGSSDTHVRTNIQTPDEDGRKDEILTESGLEFGLEKTHFLVTNISG